MDVSEEQDGGLLKRITVEGKGSAPVATVLVGREEMSRLLLLYRSLGNFGTSSL